MKGRTGGKEKGKIKENTPKKIIGEEGLDPKNNTHPKEKPVRKCLF